MDTRAMRARYTREEKDQLLANLELEVAHRTSQFQAWLEDALENFNIHQEGHVLRIPKLVRGMKMREFGAKYNGNVQAALKGIQRERLEAAASENGGGISETIKKRKWTAHQETGTEASSSSNQGDTSRAAKSARLMPASPSKAVPTKPGPSQQIRFHPIPKTPKTNRPLNRVGSSPSPSKFKPPFATTGLSRPPSRPTSPVKTSKPPPASRTRPPSTAIFNPSLPNSGPAYPGLPARLPRRDESMLSVNGSPLANPYDIGVGWIKGVNSEAKLPSDGSSERPLRKTPSILIRRDTSGSSFHSRTDSQASIFTSEASSSTHSRTSSESIQEHTFSQPAGKQYSGLPYPGLDTLATPKLPRSGTHLASAVVAISTKDGHLLEFDPLQASPGSLDALEGITDSAKKQAKDDMFRLVQAAVDKWKL